MDMYASVATMSYPMCDYDRGDHISRLSKTVMASHAYIDLKNENLRLLTCLINNRDYIPIGMVDIR